MIKYSIITRPQKLAWTTKKRKNSGIRCSNNWLFYNILFLEKRKRININIRNKDVYLSFILQYYLKYSLVNLIFLMHNHVIVSKNWEKNVLIQVPKNTHVLTTPSSLHMYFFFSSLPYWKTFLWHSEKWRKKREQ